MVQITLQTKEKILNELQNSIGANRFNTWCKNLDFEQISENIVSVPVPNKYYQEFFEQEFRKPIEEAFLKVFGEKPNIILKIVDTFKESFSITTVKEIKNATLNEVTQSKSSKHFTPQLNENYIFETFIVGPSNMLAHAGAAAVSQYPAKKYNPLFIYGSVGLGKTHLLQAICHEMLKNSPNARIIYLSCENFLNDYIYALQKGKVTEFRNKYRKADALLVDDIRFLSNKEGCQEEFFHTFNSLHSAHKQIVLSSDSPPNEIPKLEERLVSRFSWGLSAKIDIPTYETRIAILRKKAETVGKIIQDDVINYIASIITDNIRQLESAINTLVATSTLVDNKNIIDIDFAKEVLKNITETRILPITISLIQQVVSQYYKVKIEDLKGKKWTKSISFARQIGIYLSKKLTKHSLDEIGNHFGGKDHSTIIYSIDKIAKLLNTNPQLKADIEFLYKEIKLKSV